MSHSKKLPGGPWQPPGRGASWAAACFGLLCVLGWAIPALLMAHRGFSVEDEGTYLVSYRFWDSNPYFISGSQYFYGPIFHLFGQDIASLRFLRLGMAVACNGWFGWVFCTWLAAHRGIPATPMTRLAGTSLMLAAGGLTYLWTPLTPGYYDLAADVMLVMAALIFHGLTRTMTQRPFPLADSVLIGATGFVLVMTKWPAAAGLLIGLAVCVDALRPVGMSAVARHVGLVLTGFVLTGFLFDHFVAPLGDTLGVMRRVTVLSATETHGAVALAGQYVVDVVALLVGALLVGLLHFAAIALITRKPTLSSSFGLRLLLLGSLTVSCLVLPVAAGWRGGAGHGRAAVSAIAAALLGALAASIVSDQRTGLRSGRGTTPKRRSMPAIALLLLLPLAQAGGTNVPLPYVAAECLAMWVALILLLATSHRRAPAVEFAVWADITAALALVACLAGSTTLMTPFKTTGFSEDTQPVDGLHGIQVSTRASDQFAALRAGLGQLVEPPPAPYYALDQLSGVVYALGGRVVGSPWTDAATPSRSAGILEMACSRGDVDRRRPPILLLARPIDDASVRALATCGFDFPGDYAPLQVHGGPPGVRVFVPR